MRSALIAVIVYTVTLVARFGLPEGPPALFGSVLPQLLVALASLRVAMSFDAEDPPRRGWILIGVAALTMIATRVVNWLQPESYANEVILMVSNALFVAGVLVFYLIVRRNPLIRRISPRSRPWVIAASVLAVFAAAVGSVIMGKRLLSVGWTGEVADWTRLAALFGLLCDATVCLVSLQLVGLLFPMTGAAATRPYLLLAVAGLIFLLLDMLGFLLTDDFGYADFGIVLRLIVLIAWAVYTAAAVEQLYVLRDTRV